MIRRLSAYSLLLGQLAHLEGAACSTCAGSPKLDFDPPRADPPEPEPAPRFKTAPRVVVDHHWDHYQEPGKRSRRDRKKIKAQR